jgi:hypothetical protein
MAKKSKFIEDADRMKYKQQLAELMAKVNPKQSRELIEKIKRELLEKRGKQAWKY